MAPPPSSIRMDKMPSNFNPVGYPCRSCAQTQEYAGADVFIDKNNKAITSMRMKPLARGVVLGVNYTRTYFRIHIAPEDSIYYRNIGDIGWVPGNWLDVGPQRKHGNQITVREGVSLAILDRSLHYEINVFGLDATTSVLALFFKGCWETKDILTFIPEENWRNFQELGGPIAVAKLIVNGIRKAAPGYLNLLNSGAEYTFRQAQSHGRPFTADDKDRLVIYAREYWNWLNKPDKKPAQYWGYTSIGEDRNMYNDIAMIYENHFHQIYARDHQDHEVRVMCEFEDERLQPWAEQALICINRSQAPFCKDAEPSAIVLESLDAMELGPNPNDEAIRVEAADKKIQARLLIEVFAKAVAKVPRFKGGAFGQNWYGVVGLNHDSPVNAWGKQERHFVTRTRNPGVSTIYRTVPRPPISYETMKTWAFPSLISGTYNKGLHNFAVSAENDPKPPEGVRVSAVFEIMDDGKQHEVPWARVPTVGMYRNWSAANALGLRFEWKEGDQFKKMPWQNLHAYSYETTAEDTTDVGTGALHSYATAEGIRRYLEQETVTNPGAWFRNYGTARILDVSYDHLTQTTTLKEIFPGPPITLKQSFELTSQEIEDQLVAAGFERDRIGDKRGKLDTNRRSCDKCFLISGGDSGPRGRTCLKTTHSAYHPNCDKKKSCMHCLVAGMPCTFTNTRDLCNSDSMKDALTWLLLDPRCGTRNRFIADTIDPKLVEVR
ncbi:hypothetical protein QM012_009236 [Aureobasidium pullulans]|uniref:Uncharacterized protein n=1 Tax=Aureobasidium pullulans TaxID=5580 RepID=A0ABR0TGC3_AURPU